MALRRRVQHGHREALYGNGVEKRSGDLTCKGSELNSEGIAEQGCAEAKLGEAMLCYGRERRSEDEQWRRAEQTRIAKEINDEK